MDINSSFQLGSVTFANRLVQGPLAGFSCAPFRAMYALFQQPAYCVSEMISAQDLLCRQAPRFIYRAPIEQRLAYQLSGDDPQIMAQAAHYLESIGADMIDLNCGCPKAKIRKKGAGSALLDKPARLMEIITAVKSRINIPLTVKLRIQHSEQDVVLARAIESAGADGVIVHGRSWQEDYDQPCDMQQIALIKQNLRIPVIANGDMTDKVSVQHMMNVTQCDAYMISRAGTGRPWLYQHLLHPDPLPMPNMAECIEYFMLHLNGLAQLEQEHRAILQSKTLVRYYFKPWIPRTELQDYYALDSLRKIEQYLHIFMKRISDEY
ncbi:MAG: nitrogen regulation protein [Legionella sp.]|nr:MAG: nitrogen regulation protein [Legionella sp.]